MIPSGQFFNGSNFSGGSVQIGELFTPSYTSGDFTKAAGVNAVYTTNSIRITTPTDPADFNNTLLYNGIRSDNENYIQSCTFTVNADGATAHGFSIGVWPLYHDSVYACVGMGGGNEGKLFLFINTANTATAKLFDVDNGDIINLSLTRNKNVFTANVTNVTKGVSGQIQNTFPTNSVAGNVLPSVSRFGFQMFGGDVTVTSWGASSLDYTNPDMLIIGDSKTSGYDAATDSVCYTGLWRSNNPTKRILRSAGPSKTAADVVTYLAADVAKYGTPRKVIIFVGRNDISVGASVATTVAHLQTIAGWFPSSQVWVQLSLPEKASGGVDTTALNTAITAAFSGRTLSIPATWNGETDNADPVHPNDIGHPKIHTNQASTISL